MSYGLSYENSTEKTAKTYDNGGAANRVNGSNPQRIGADGGYRQNAAKTRPQTNISRGPRTSSGGSFQAAGINGRTAKRQVPGSVNYDPKRRTVSRVPNMSSSSSGAKRSFASNAKAVPVAGLHIEPTIKTVKDKKKKPLHIPAFIAGGLCTALFMYMLTNFVMINEYTKSITVLRNELNDLVEQERKLSLQLEKRNNLQVIEEKATELGMVKVDQVSKQYVVIKSEDKIEILNDSQ